MSLQLIAYFRDQLVKFIDEIIEQFPDKPDFVLVKLIVKDKVSMTDVMGRYIQTVIPEKDVIVNRNLDFFKKDFVKGYEDWPNLNRIFLEVKSLYFSDRLDDDERDTIWRWMDLFLRICEKYYIKYGPIEGWEIKEKDKSKPFVKEILDKREEFIRQNS